MRPVTLDEEETWTETGMHTKERPQEDTSTSMPKKDASRHLDVTSSL